MSVDVCIFFSSCKRKTCIDYGRSYANRSEYACFFRTKQPGWSANRNRSKIQSTWPTYRGHKHFSLSHRVSGDHWFFLNTLILHRVQFFSRTAAHRQTWKYSDLAALLSNGLAHTIYFARLFFIPLPTEFNSIECIFVLCMDLKRNSCKRKPNSTSTTHGQHTRL